MECQVVRDMLSEYIDDELIQEQKGRIDLHLRDCEACRKELEELLIVHRLFTDAESFTAPYGFSTRVMANLEETKESIWSGFFARPILFRAIGTAFALIIVIIGLISGNILTARKPPSLTSAEVTQSFALNAFEATPSGSIGGLYVSMTGVRNEK
jgi:predicted anti-sigma-YlaC factor YlaD